MISKEVRQQIKKVTNQILYEDKKRKELLNKQIDYNFLQQLIDKSSRNPDLVITIYFKSGDKLVLRQKYQAPANDYSYDGNPATNELEIK